MKIEKAIDQLRKAASIASGIEEDLTLTIHPDNSIRVRNWCASVPFLSIDAMLEVANKVKKAKKPMKPKNILGILAVVALLAGSPVLRAGKPEHLGGGPETFTYTLKNVAGYKTFAVCATHDFRSWRTVATFHKGEDIVTFTDRATKNRRYQFYVIRPVGGGR